MATLQEKLNLGTALVCAKYVASKIEIEDGGTCNFDCPYIVLPGWKESDVRKTFEDAKLRLYKMGVNTYEILDAVEGQGFRRTEMAREFSKCLKTFGYDAGVHYVID